MNYAQFLTWLLTLSAKLPEALAALAELETFFADWLAKHSGLFSHPAAAHSLAAHQSTAEEHALEKQVIALAKEHATPEHHAKIFGAIGDGSILRALAAAWTFLQQNPQLLALLLSLFGKKA